MTFQIIGVAIVVAVLLVALFVYGMVSKSKDSMMQGGCHGNCSSCPSNCKNEQRKNK